MRVQAADDPVWGPFRPFRGGSDRGLPPAAVVHAAAQARSHPLATVIPGEVLEEPWKGNQRVPAAPEVDDYHARVLAPLGEAARLRHTPKKPVLEAPPGDDYADSTSASPAIQSTTRNVVTVNDDAVRTKRFQFAALRAPSERMNLKDFSSRFSFKRDYRYLLINYNKELTDMLTELQAMYECKLHGNDDFRAKNLKLVIETIKRVPFRVRDWAEFKGWLDRLPDAARKRTGLGDKWVEKIKGYCTYGVLADLENRRSAPASQSARDLVRLFGVGPSKAKEMVRQGIGGIADLRERVAQGKIPTWGNKGFTPLLEKDSLKCLPLLEDLEQRIPRAEVEELLAKVREAADVAYGPGNVRLTVCGSYRRGKASCGDMDIIITTVAPVTRGVMPGPAHRPDAPLPSAPPLRPLLDQLERLGLISEHLRFNADAGEMFMKSANISSRVQQEGLKRVMDAAARVGVGRGGDGGGGVEAVWQEYRSASLKDTLLRLRTAGEVGYDMTPGYAKRGLESAAAATTSPPPAAASTTTALANASSSHAPNARDFRASGLRWAQAHARGGRGRGAGTKRRQHEVSPGGDGDSQEETPTRGGMRRPPPPSPSPPRPPPLPPRLATHAGEAAAHHGSQVEAEDEPPLEVHSPTASQRAATEALAESGLGVSRTPTRPGRQGEEMQEGGAAEGAAGSLEEEERPVDPASLPYLPWPPTCYDHEMWMGILRLPGPGQRTHRRVDIKAYPAEVYPFALLYFTGSGFFNRSLRLYVQKCGWSLSDRGLCPSYRSKGAPGKGWDKTWEGHSVACESEEDFFAACGLPYIAPEAREASVEEVGIEEAIEARRRARTEDALRGLQPSSSSSSAGPTGASKGKGKARYVCPGGLEALLAMAQRERNSGLGPLIMEEVRVEREKRARLIAARAAGGGGVGDGSGADGTDAAEVAGGDDDDVASLLGAESQAGELPLEIQALVQGPLDVPAEGEGPSSSMAGQGRYPGVGADVHRLSAMELLEEEDGQGEMAGIAYGLASRLHAVGSGR